MIVIKTSVVLLAVGVGLVKANSDKCAAKCDKTFSGEGSKVRIQPYKRNKNVMGSSRA